MELCESFKLNHWIRVYPSYLHTLFPFDYLTHELFIGWGLLICSCARNFDQFSFSKSLLFSYSWWTIVLGTKSWTQLNTHARTFLKHVNRVFWSMVHCTETLDLISWESNWEITLGNELKVKNQLETLKINQIGDFMQIIVKIDHNPLSAKTITVSFILALLVDQYVIMVLICIFLITQITNDVKHFICLLDICMSSLHCAQVFDVLSLSIWVVDLYLWWIYSSLSLISASNLYLYHLCHLYLCFISSSLWLTVD